MAIPRALSIENGAIFCARPPRLASSRASREQMLIADTFGRVCVVVWVKAKTQQSSPVNGRLLVIFGPRVCFLWEPCALRLDRSQISNLTPKTRNGGRGEKFRKQRVKVIAFILL